LFGISVTAERSVLGTLQDISIIPKAAERIAIADARGISTKGPTVWPQG
jgi:hypothetical protein